MCVGDVGGGGCGGSDPPTTPGLYDTGITNDVPPNGLISRKPDCTVLLTP